MNEFIEQFLVESRELVEQATADLLALEERPGERERLDSAFRGFHTLKGAAAIMEFEPMVRALHAAEDVLSVARAEGTSVGPVLVGDCLAALDQVVRWLDAIEATGEMPADADVAAAGLARRFAQPGPAAETPPAEPRSWPLDVLARHPEAAGAAYALRYDPGSQAFFDDVDPLADLATLTGVLALDIVAAEPPPTLADLDPFVSLMAFEVLLDREPGAAAQALQRPGAHVEVVRLEASPPPSPLDLPPPAAELLEAQVLMLRAAQGEGGAGRTGAAARVAVNVLRRVGLAEHADRLADIATRTAADDAEAFAIAVEDLLAGRLATPDAEAAAVQLAPEAAIRSLRVEVERVDALVNLIGELMVAKNALGHAVTSAEAGAPVAELARTLRRQHAQLDRLVEELQRSVLNMRVLPMRQVFQRFPRIVREMVSALGKPTRLVTEGDATEADKAIVEGLFEPLLHVLRNALDHGVETSAERAAAGKSPSATITLRARRESDRVFVEVEDDGRGLDLDRIRAVAIERDVMPADEVEALTDGQAADLVFAPGFSTARQVSDLSGRGVGMDAVRASVERMGGHVSLHSRSGQGTLVRLSLPFTIVMTRVLTVEASGQMFGIPLEAVVETLRLKPEDVRAIGSAEAFVLRDRTLPLIDLADALAGGSGASAETDRAVVVAQAGGQLAGLAVGRLGERLDVMLKPMDGLLANVPAIMGTTLMGDGRVLLVLDLAELLG